MYDCTHGCHQFGQRKKEEEEERKEERRDVVLDLGCLPAGATCSKYAASSTYVVDKGISLWRKRHKD